MFEPPIRVYVSSFLLFKGGALALREGLSGSRGGSGRG